MLTPKVIPYVLCILLVLAVTARFAIKKQGYFLDELYTFGLSNSYYEPFVDGLAEDGLNGSVLSHDELQGYLTVQPGQEYSFDSVCYNQSKDVHPPLYYLLIHTVSSLFPNTFSKWIGLGVQSLLWFSALVLIYRICQVLFGRDRIALICTAAYALTSAGLSTFLMIRMYLLMTVLTLLLTLLILKLEDSWSLSGCFGVGMVIFLGLMTQYLFVVFAFLICALFDLRLLYRKRFRDMFLFSLIAFAGVGLFFLAWPSAIDHLFKGGVVSGSSLLSNASSPESYIASLRTFCKQFIEGTEGFITVCIVLLFFILIRLGKTSADQPAPDTPDDIDPDNPRFWTFSLMAIALLSGSIIAVAVPYKTIRYVFHLVPYAVLFLGYLLWLLDGMESVGDRGYLALTLVVLLTMTAFLRIRQPSFLYEASGGYGESLEEYASEPCVFFHPYCRRASVTRNLQQLILFDDVLFLDEVDGPLLHRYADGHGGRGPIIVFYDDWGAEDSAQSAVVLEEIRSCLGLSSYELVYTFGTTEVFIIE